MAVEALDFPVVLEGEKVRLRAFSAQDIDDAYLGWLGDLEVTRFSNQRFRKYDVASASAYLQSFVGTKNLFLSIRRIADDRAIGTMTAYVAAPHGTVDIGIMIGDRSCWGQGYGQEAWSLLVQWFLVQPGIRKVTAGTSDRNLSMIRTAERAGMKLEGRRRAQEIIDDAPADLLYFARFKDDR